MMLAMVMIMQNVVSVGVTADFSVFSGNFGYENFYNLSNDSGDTNPLDANGGATNTLYKAGSVKTGDETPIALYLIFLAGAAAIAGAIIFIKRRKSSK